MCWSTILTTAGRSAASALTISCPAGLPYQIGLDQGTGLGASTANRFMTGPGAAQVKYLLFTDSARTIGWGNALNVDTQTSTGIGLPQTIPVYGRVPVQTTPVAGAYADSVTVTVTY